MRMVLVKVLGNLVDKLLISSKVPSGKGSGNPRIEDMDENKA